MFPCRVAEVTKKKKPSKRLGRQRQSQASMDDIPPSGSKKATASSLRTRASTFSSASSPSCSSKTSFFSSFAPRWGRSQSYTSAAASTSKVLSRYVFVNETLMSLTVRCLVLWRSRCEDALWHSSRINSTSYVECMKYHTQLWQRFLSWWLYSLIVV